MNKRIDDLTLAVYKADTEIFDSLSRLRNVMINLQIIASSLDKQHSDMINAVVYNVNDNIGSLFDKTKFIKDSMIEIANINKGEHK